MTGMSSAMNEDIILEEVPKALIEAAYQGELQKVKDIIAEFPGLDINYMDEHGLNATYYAVAGRHPEVLKVLIAAGGNINIKTRRGKSLLMLACELGNFELVDILLRAGAPADEVYPLTRETALLLAAARNNHDDRILQALIAAGADVNRVDDMGNSALMRAVQAQNLEKVRMLLAAGANVNYSIPQGLSALLLAAGRDSHILELLIQAGANVNASYRGESPLMSAAFLGLKKNVELLLAAGADPNFVSVNGNTALLEAATAGHAEIVDILIEEGADVNHANGDGETALMRAAHFGYVDIVDLLMHAFRIDIYRKTQFGRTARDIAEKRLEVKKQIHAERVAHGEATADIDRDIRDLTAIVKILRDIEYRDAINTMSRLSVMGGPGSVAESLPVNVRKLIGKHVAGKKAARKSRRRAYKRKATRRRR
jgi:ankyrin repeat protein